MTGSVVMVGDAIGAAAAAMVVVAAGGAEIAAESAQPVRSADTAIAVIGNRFN
jgi:hypothetical protein